VRDVTIAVMVTSNGHNEADGALNHEDSQPERHSPGDVTGTRRRLVGGGATWRGWDPQGGRRVVALADLGRRSVLAGSAVGWNSARAGGGGLVPLSACRRRVGGI
jgi:hypothetical protein